MNQPSRRTQQFPCESCGAQLRFDAVRGWLICAHCGHEDDITGQSDNLEAPFHVISTDGFDEPREPKSTSPKKRADFLHCNTCGANVQLANTSHSAECPFCASNLMSKVDNAELVEVDGIIPFAISEKDARNNLIEWLRAQPFNSRAFENHLRMRKQIHPIYMPFWVFDIRSRTRYSGYQRSLGVNLQTDWSSVSGMVTTHSPHALVAGSLTISHVRIENIGPWNFSGVTRFFPKYLAGFHSEIFTNDLETAQTRGRAVHGFSAEADIRADIEGVGQTIKKQERTILSERYQRVYLPVYALSYVHRSKRYFGLVNGQTGKATGDVLVDQKRLVATIVGLLIGAGGLFWLADILTKLI